MNSAIEKLALAYPDTEKSQHFEVISFKVRNKIFMTHNQAEERICVKLNEIDQSAFSAAGKGSIFPVPNKWGKHGWTLVELKNIHPDLLKDAIETAYNNVLSTSKPARKKKNIVG